MDYSKTHFNLTYHPIMDNYKEFENITRIDKNDIQLLLPSWRENIPSMFDKGTATELCKGRSHSKFKIKKSMNFHPL